MRFECEPAGARVDEGVASRAGVAILVRRIWQLATQVPHLMEEFILYFKEQASLLAPPV
jgi:hypothetical protein